MYVLVFVSPTPLHAPDWPQRLGNGELKDLYGLMEAAHVTGRIDMLKVHFSHGRTPRVCGSGADVWVRVRARAPRDARLKIRLRST